MRVSKFWHVEEKEILEQLRTTAAGLSSIDAQKRLKQFGKNLLKSKKEITDFSLFLSQFKSPLILLLLGAAVFSFFLHDRIDSTIIFIIVVASGLLGFFQERKAVKATEKLLAIVKIRSSVLRDGKRKEVGVEKLVPGDVIYLSAGDTIPADCRLLEAKDFFVDEAALTGEPLPVEKKMGLIDEAAPLAKRKNVLFMGSHAISGSAKAVIVLTGKETEFGKISSRLQIKSPETAFETGIRHFGYFLMQVTLVLVIVIFVVNIFLHKPILLSFLFALALAVGLTPQLLPAIISINLAHGATQMARRRVIVKKLSSIENFGSMTVLCVDKTGTLTQGRMDLQLAGDISGQASQKTLLFAFLNASMQTGYLNPLDTAIIRAANLDTSKWKKLDEYPYDFIRKRLTILAGLNGESVMITKGAFAQMLTVCSQAEQQGERIVPLDEVKDQLQMQFEEYGKKGIRTLGLAYRPMGSKNSISHEDEKEMIFLGFLLFFDPPKAGIKETIFKLKECGITLKVISGDNRLVAAHVADEVGLSSKQILTGAEISKLSDPALLRKVHDIEIFAEVEPNQKERIILALRKNGETVGFLGDGINDATAIHTADVGISVESAVDVAKEVADIVLLSKDLSVLLTGVKEGRKTFSNTMKYIFMATSANFGNMFSMAGSSLFLPFLPLLPKQILLTNLLTDFPEMSIATDSVDEEVVEKPVRWDLQFIRRFMIVFGLISSFFDFLTFGVLLFILKASPDEFRTGWFVESVISASSIVLIIRTFRRFYRSRPSMYLLFAVLAIIALTCALPFMSISKLFSFTRLPLIFYIAVAAITIAYIISVEIAKHFFFKKQRKI